MWVVEGVLFAIYQFIISVSLPFSSLVLSSIVPSIVVLLVKPSVASFRRANSEQKGLLCTDVRDC